MDKFGILSLLNSLLGFTSDKNDGKPPFREAPSAENPPPVKTAGPNKPLNTGGKPAEEKPVSDFLPLQEGMLSTIKKHDELIKRVKEKNKT